MSIAFILHHLRIIPGQFCSWETFDWTLRMGTKILQRRLPDWTVVRCERIEDALLWEKYTAKRAQHHVWKVWRVFWVHAVHAVLGGIDDTILYQAFKWSNWGDWGNNLIESSQNENNLEFVSCWPDSSIPPFVPFLIQSSYPCVQDLNFFNFPM